MNFKKREPLEGWLDIHPRNDVHECGTQGLSWLPAYLGHETFVVLIEMSSATIFNPSTVDMTSWAVGALLLPVLWQAHRIEGKTRDA